MKREGPTPRTYAYTAAALFVLLAATVVTAYVETGGLGLVLTPGIAVAKATLIGLFFMHVRYGQPIVRVFATAGLLWLTILFWLTLNDFPPRRAPNLAC